MQYTTTNAPFVTSVLHPSDFSEESERAFAHALAISLVRKAKFTIMHAGNGGEKWSRFPGVRETLERWGRLEKGSPRSAVFDELQLKVQKVEMKTRNAVKASLAFMDSSPTDLVVLSTHARHGLPRWLHGSVAEDLARLSHIKTLFVPAEAKGLVSTEDGRVSMRRILVPIDHKPDPDQAIEYARRSTVMRDNDEPVEITIFHVGESMPPHRKTDDPNCVWKTRLQPDGDPVDEIAKAADEMDADLVIMATDGRDNLIDAFRGSHSERLVRQIHCPLLAVPSV